MNSHRIKIAIDASTMTLIRSQAVPLSPQNVRSMLAAATASAAPSAGVLLSGPLGLRIVGPRLFMKVDVDLERRRDFFVAASSTRDALRARFRPSIPARALGAATY